MNGHSQQVKRTLPHLIIDMSILFVVVQASLAALHGLVHFIATRIKH